MKFLNDNLWKDFALHREAAEHLANFLYVNRPQSVLECGSGASTLIFAQYAKDTGASFTSLEHDEKYLQQTQSLLKKYGLEANVVHAPLTHVDLPGGFVKPWYDFTTDEKFDFVLIDGPPGYTGGRHATLIRLAENNLVDGGVFWLDDANRPSEEEAIALWESYLDTRTKVIKLGSRSIAEITLPEDDV